MNKSQILIISPEPWSGHFVSKHHYALTLGSQGREVYFLNPPINSLKEVQIQKTEYLNVWEVSAPQIAKGLRFYPKFLRNLLEKRWLDKLEEKIGESFTTVWLFENSRFYDMNFAGEKTKIYHQMDSNQSFHPRVASASADISFCVTDYIRKDLLATSDKVFKISHGIHFFHDTISLTNEEQNRFSHDGIHVVYVGNLDMNYIDENLVYEMVSKYPNIDFHFIGNYSEKGTVYTLCKDMPNIVWWGSVPSTHIPMILNYADISLLVYRSKQYKEQLANSHKLLEYLASGKVTVATYTDEYKDKRELLEMVDDASKVVEKFSEVVNDLEYYNSKEKQQMRINFAKENSYEKQLKKIVGYLKQYNLKL